MKKRIKLLLIIFVLLIISFFFLFGNNLIALFGDHHQKDIFAPAGPTKNDLTNNQDLKNPITISPSEIRLEKEKSRIVTAHFYNMGNKTTTFKPEVYQSSTGNLEKGGIKCTLLDTQPVTLAKEESYLIKMNVKENKGDLTLGDAYSCHIKITGGNLGKSNSTATLIVEVE